ncbi:MAG: 5-deoxy-glucuronate isomerase [Anaerolineales bacterium]|nr:5-deoxy-glucuronate isomerase [Anaerolineales bacterium]
MSITPEEAGWDYISFQVRRLENGRFWSFASGENELAIVILSGNIAVLSNRGQWQGICRTYGQARRRHCTCRVTANLPSPGFPPTKTMTPG